MAQKLKAFLFGRQLSHGSENESPVTFEDALQPNFDFTPQQQEVRHIVSLRGPIELANSFIKN